MSTTMTQVEKLAKLGRGEAMRLAATEYERFDDLLGKLSGDDWSKPTDCDRWTVKDILAHLVQMAGAMQSMREMMRQQRAGKSVAKAEGLTNFDGWTEFQVKELADLSTDELVRRYRDAIPGLLAARGRSTPLRLARFPSQPYGWFSMAYLRDDILTRDVWMHRVDISRATGHELVLTSEHDGRFIANIVRDLAQRWKKPFTLKLDGPAGGTFVKGSGGVDVRVDAIELCRILSGRSTGHGLPTDVVPF